MLKFLVLLVFTTYWVARKCEWSISKGITKCQADDKSKLFIRMLLYGSPPFQASKTTRMAFLLNCDA